jgi:hypothetical protein
MEEKAQVRGNAEERAIATMHIHFLDAARLPALLPPNTPTHAFAAFTPIPSLILLAGTSWAVSLR